DAPVIISGYGNKLIVTSDDPEALALVQELVRLLTQTEGGVGDFEVIKLKYANAVEAAKVLDELFNGTKETKEGMQPRGRGLFLPGLSEITRFGGGLQEFMKSGGGGFFGGGGARIEKVRIVADPATNSLIVRGVPLDVLTIRSLLTRYIDTMP